MKKEIHPKNYRTVLFHDISCDAQFLLDSTVPTTETAVYKADGKEYPVYTIEISSSSHPFYTGKENILDTAGRIDKFKSRQAKATKK